MLTKKYLVSAFTSALLAISSSIVTSQTTWDKHPGNPVLSPGTPPAWDETVAIVNTVLFHDGIFKMWYEGDDSFGYATSPNGIVWTKYGGNPVMVPGGNGAWDEHNIDNASVVAVADTFHMWYSGVDAQDDNRIGHATSPDGIVWTRDPANPVIDTDDPFAWDSQEAIHPFVIHENNVFKMWYNGHDGLEQRILYATSPDGSVWTKFTSLFMLEPGPMGQWDEEELGPPCVLRANDGYHMWYTGWNQAQEFALGYATSPDGISWTKDVVNNPVLEPGSPPSWDESMVAIPYVMLIDSVLTMWYGGSDGSAFETGYATSNSILVPTFLRSFHAVWTESGVAIDWLLSQAGIGARFSVLRNRPPEKRFVPLSEPEIRADRLHYRVVDETVEPGAAYRYMVVVSDEDGERSLFETQLIAVPALTMALNRISPNPFNPQTTIVYTIARTGPVTLGVYDASGRLIRKLVDRLHTAGRFTQTWNGRNHSGATVASGVYFVRLQSRGEVTIKKAVLLK